MKPVTRRRLHLRFDLCIGSFVRVARRRTAGLCRRRFFVDEVIGEVVQPVGRRVDCHSDRWARIHGRKAGTGGDFEGRQGRDEVLSWAAVEGRGRWLVEKQLETVCEGGSSRGYR